MGVGVTCRDQRRSVRRDGIDDASFARPVEPTRLHHYLASLSLPVMVDVWYDAVMRAALGKRDGWGEVQGYHPRRHWRNSLISLLRFTWREVGSAWPSAGLRGCCTSRRVACSRPTTSLSPPRTTSGVDRNRHSDASSGHHEGKVNQTDLLIGCRLTNSCCLAMRGRSSSARPTPTMPSLIRTRSLATSSAFYSSKA